MRRKVERKVFYSYLSPGFYGSARQFPNRWSDSYRQQSAKLCEFHLSTGANSTRRVRMLFWQRFPRQFTLPCTASCHLYSFVQISLYIRDFGVFFRFVHLYRRSTIFIHYSQPIDPPLRDAILSANVEIEKFRAIQIYSMFACHHISFHHKTLAHKKISDIRVYEFFFCVCLSLRWKFPYIIQLGAAVIVAAA